MDATTRIEAIERTDREHAMVQAAVTPWMRRAIVASLAQDLTRTWQGGDEEAEALAARADARAEATMEMVRLLFGSYGDAGAISIMSDAHEIARAMEEIEIRYQIGTPAEQAAIEDEGVFAIAERMVEADRSAAFATFEP